MKAIRPYIERPVHDLIYIAAILRQRDIPLPLDLEQALVSNGINTASI